MTFALVRRGAVIDHARFDTFRQLAGWTRGRERRAGVDLVMVDLDVGQELRAGDRVEVGNLAMRLATPVALRLGRVSLSMRAQWAQWAQTHRSR